MALGEQLREARLRRKLSASEVAAATRMKVQTVEALEREDFKRMPAPIYCKGFIKIYAEYIGLNPDTLLAEYTQRFVEPKQQSLIIDQEATAVKAAAAQKSEQPKVNVAEQPQQPSEPDLFAFAEEKKKKEVEAEVAVVNEKAAQQSKQEMPTGETVASAVLSEGEKHEVDEKAKEEISSLGKLLKEQPEFKIPKFELPRFNFQMVRDNLIARISIGIGLLIIAILVFSMLSKHIKSATKAFMPGKGNKELPIAVEPSPPYVN